MSTVTASTIGLAGDWLAASTAAFSILLPPEAWTVSMLTPSSAAERDRRRDGVRDVVIFQVEKHLPAGGDQVADDLRPLGREELFPDLVGGCGVADGLDDLAGLRGARDIERHYEPVFVVHRLKFTALRQDYCAAFVLGYERGLDDVQPDRIHAVVAHAEHFGRAIGQVNDPVLPYGSAIIDADDD